MGFLGTHHRGYSKDLLLKDEYSSEVITGNITSLEHEMSTLISIIHKLLGQYFRPLQSISSFNKHRLTENKAEYAHSTMITLIKSLEIASLQGKTSLHFLST